MIMIPLTKGQVTVIDDCDRDLARFNWFAVKAARSSTYYAARNIHSKRARSGWEKQQLHRAIGKRMGFKNEVDHKDHNGLNNRRGNLQDATRSQNMMNRRKHAECSSLYKGVNLHKRCNKYQAYIGINKKQITLAWLPGNPEGEKDAARAYNKAARELFKDRAYLNRIEDRRTATSNIRHDRRSGQERRDLINFQNGQWVPT